MGQEEHVLLKIQNSLFGGSFVEGPNEMKILLSSRIVCSLVVQTN
jgi:hypothetical protein